MLNEVKDKDTWLKICEMQISDLRGKEIELDRLWGVYS